MKELVDGTIRVQIDIDPIHRADFFAAFSRIDMPVALAPLVANFERIKPEAPAVSATPFFEFVADKPKGGELAKWAGILSNNPVFWEFLADVYGYDVVDSEIKPADAIRTEAGVDSRAELDHNPEAGKHFRHMMGEFDDWKNGGRAA